MQGHIGGVQIQAQSLTVQGNSFVADGQVTLTNNSETVTAYVGATTTDVSGHVTQDMDIDLPPGQSYTLQAPPQGQQWTLVILTRPQVRRAIEETGIVGLVILGLAGYGGYRIIRDRPWRRY